MFSLFCAAVALAIAVQAGPDAYPVPQKSNPDGQPFDAFVSHSIEFSSFPEFAGNKSHPNEFSFNLLKNLGQLMGTNPYIRVGGNTQDYALYNASQKIALVGIVDPNRSPDYPTTIHIGRAYLESYHTWPGFKFSHGLNMGLGGNRSEGWQTLVDTVPLVCATLSHGNLYTWEYGNEPDLFSTSAQGPVRPSNWDETQYIWQWHNATKEIKQQIRNHCPHLAARGEPKFMAPSLAGTSNHLNATLSWEDGLNRDNDISYFSTHNYISGATSPGVTLQGTLMSHSRTKQSVEAHVVEYNRIKKIQNGLTPPLIFGETNSLYNQGRPGLSNTFGAALWGINFNLYSASVGFKRVHMHQGTNYRYQAWQPVDTDKASIGTKAPYYGTIAVASMLRDTTRRPVSVSNIPLTDDHEAAYAAHYVHRSRNRNSDKLARIIVLNMRGYNTTVDGAGLEPLPNPPARESKTYKFDVGSSARDGQRVTIQRLMANGSDAITGIAFDGWSYNRELKLGQPVRLHNFTIGEITTVKKGMVEVSVPDSSAALLSLSW